MGYVARHAGKVNSKGELVLSDPVAWRAAVAKHQGREVWVTVRRQTHQRTMPQNRYYWSVVVSMIAGYIGESREQTHEYLKQMHLPKRDVELLDGRHLEMPPTTTTLDVEGMTEYIERCIRWAASFLGLVIPDAKQVEVLL